MRTPELSGDEHSRSTYVYRTQLETTEGAGCYAKSRRMDHYDQLHGIPIGTARLQRTE